MVKTTNTSRTSSWPSASMASELRVDLRALGMVFCLFFLRVVRGGEFCFDAKIKKESSFHFDDLDDLRRN